MSHPYKTRSGGATVTIFVPYDCRNHCPFCINKKEYADCTGFSVEAILRSVAVMDAITPECDFVFTGGEPFAQMGDLQRMLDAIPGTHKVYINTTFPVQPGCSAEEMIDFTRRNADKITCINVSRHLQRYVEESPDEVVAAIATPKRINCVLYKNYPADKLTEYVERWRKYNIPIQFRYDWSYFALLGFLTVTLHMSLLQMAVLHMDASATSIIYSGNPVFALAAAHLILHEPLKRNHLIAIGVELIGILFILNPAKLEVSPRGFAEILTATILFAMYGTLCKLRIPRLGGLVITTFNMVLGGLELLALLLLGHIPAVGALYRSLGLDIFADVPFFTGFTLRSALLLCYVGIFCAAIGFLLTAKITEYTSATEASFVYLIKPVLATLLAVVCFRETISVNRMIGLVFFLAASLCVSVPVLREMRRDAVTAQPPR